MLSAQSISEETLKKASKSFYTASLLLPERLRSDVVTLYAWCRKVDDDIDEAHDNETRQKNWGKQKARLDAIYPQSGDDENGKKGQVIVLKDVDKAFADLVRTYNIPKEFPGLLVEGQLWDCQGKQYNTFEDLSEYCVRVASSVGLMMCCLMRVRSPEAYKTASSLGIAMQLTNIARDVGEDARNGKVYVPLQWLKEEGITEEQLLGNPTTFTVPIGRLVKRLLDKADEFYAEGRKGIVLLPEDCRHAILSSAHIYQHIKYNIISNGYNSISHRAFTSKTTKMLLLWISLWEVFRWSTPIHMANLLKLFILQIFLIPILSTFHFEKSKK